MSDIDEAYSIDNLRRSWRWTRSYALPEYKNYFRDVYAAFSLASEANLCHLKDKLDRRIFEPTQACKAYPVKSSGLLRTYTLLSIEDQLVYQALVNVIAERFVHRRKHGPIQNVYGNLYAGKTSQFFYRRWQDQYKEFTKGIYGAHSEGYRWVYSFDLTAFFDSISHEVLRSLLKRLSLDEMLVEELLRCLKKWTAIAPPIYHGHGIPQGPQPSGILAEVVMAEIDQGIGRPRTVKYFRYVDDIWLLAKTERTLREMAVRLDLLSKSIGLFPQATKIALEKVADPSEIVKSISNPPDRPLPGVIKGTQKEREAELNRLTKNLIIGPGAETRFKFVLERTKPTSRLAQRLIRILERRPHLYGPTSRHLARFRKFPVRVATSVLEAIKNHSNYSSIASALLDSSFGKVEGNIKAQYAQEALKLYREASKRTRGRVDELMASSFRWCVESGNIAFKQLKDVLYGHQDEAWWFRKEILSMIPHDVLGPPSASELVATALTDPSADVAIVAADILVTRDYPHPEDAADLNPYAVCTLNAFNLLPTSSPRSCGIEMFLQDMLKCKLPEFNWQHALGGDYPVAEKIAVRVKASAEGDATQWVNLLDTFHDLLLKALFAHDSTIGRYRSIGAVLQPKSRLAKNYPNLYSAVNNVHQKRLESDLSHPYNVNTGKPTSRVKYRFISSQRRALNRGYNELINSW